MTDLEPLIRRFLGAYAEADLEAMLALVSDEVVFEHYTGGARSTRAQGKAAFAELARGSAAAFASRSQTIRRLTKGDGCATAEIEFQAVPARDLPNGMKAGVPVTLLGASVYEGRDGVLTRVSDYG